MKILRTVLWLAVIVVIIGVFLLHTMVINIPMGTVGIRVQQFALFGPKGVVKQDYKPGWHRKIPGIDRWELFDSTVQTLDMTRNPDYGDRAGADDVKVTSADGYTVSVDVTLKYRIMPGSVNDMYEVIGGGQKYKAIVRTEAEKACMEELGKMKTEEFYNPKIRRSTASEIKKQLQIAFETKYIEVIDLLIREVEFDKHYEDKIRQKKLSDQEVELNKSLAKAAEMSGKTQVIEAETKRLVNIVARKKEAELVRMEAEADREISKLRADFEKYATQKKADADLKSAQMLAKGELLVKTAEADGEKLRNKAMQGVGGSTIVALEAAKNLNLKNVTISTLDVDILDLDQMATKLGVPESKPAGK